MTGAARILYVNSWSTAHGGSSTSLIDITTHLDASRFEPIVLCPEEGELPDRLRHAGVRVHVHPISRLTREEVARFLLEVPRYMRFLRRERVRLVHGNTSASRRSVLEAGRLLRVPYVQHVRNGARNARAQRGYYVASRIIANSNAVAADLVSDPLFAAKTVTIHNAVDLSRYDAGDDRRGEIGAGDRPIVGFVGQLVPRKGLTTLIEAMPAVRERCPSVLLVIVGCAPPDEQQYERECRAHAARLGVADSIVFAGYRTDVPAWMRTFDVFAFPTRSEPFGKVIIEAMAAGTPVVASRVGGIPEIITSESLGSLLQPDDPRALADAILRHLTDRGFSARVSAAARASVTERFGLEAMVGRLQGLYDEVLHEANGNAGQ
jgi:glycosyltransferase involved in cell wall biosynthesis